MEHLRTILLLSSVLLAGGCSTPHVIRGQHLPLYGADPMRHTVYLGSDANFHHFALQDGFWAREVLVRCDESVVKPATFPVESGMHAFIASASVGEIRLVVLGNPRPTNQSDEASRSVRRATLEVP